MKTADFIKTHCYYCDDYDPSLGGCQCYADEECDYAFCHPEWRGKKMVERISDYLEKKHEKESQNES